MRHLSFLGIFTVIISCVVVVSALASDPSDVPRIDKERVKAMLGDDRMVLLDVRRAADWDSGQLKIKGAIRKDPREVEKWADELPKNKTLVFYCA